jgi:hypothetical protein
MAELGQFQPHIHVGKTVPALSRDNRRSHSAAVRSKRLLYSHHEYATGNNGHGSVSAGTPFMLGTLHGARWACCMDAAFCEFETGVPSLKVAGTHPACPGRRLQENSICLHLRHTGRAFCTVGCLQVFRWNFFSPIYKHLQKIEPKYILDGGACTWLVLMGDYISSQFVATFCNWLLRGCAQRVAQPLVCGIGAEVPK